MVLFLIEIPEIYRTLEIAPLKSERYTFWTKQIKVLKKEIGVFQKSGGGVKLPWLSSELSESTLE